MTTIHDPPNHHVIKEIYLFISKDEQGEGVVAAPINNMMMPLIASDQKALDSIRPIAEMLAKMTKKEIKLIKFTTREDLGVIK